MIEPTLEQIVRDALAAWAGWPSGEWLVTTVARSHRRPRAQVEAALASLVERRVVARVEHKGEVVFRME